jgi:hypothetical protein
MPVREESTMPRSSPARRFHAALRLIALLPTAFLSTHLAAATWPGPAPCNTTLQACVNATASGSFVEIATNTPIDESVTVSRSLTLRPAAGYSPNFEAGNVLLLFQGSGTPMNVYVSGLRFRAGYVGLSQLDNAITAELNHITIDALRSGATAGIKVDAAGTYPMRLQVYDSRVTMNGPQAPGASAIDIFRGSVGTAEFIAKVRANRIVANGAGDAAGIRIVTGVGAVVEASGNHVTGKGFGNGLVVEHTGGGTPSRVDLTSNYVRGQGPGTANDAGIVVDGRITLNALNNTVIDGERGMLLRSDASGTLGGVVANNLLAYNRVAGLDIDPISSLTNQANLLHGNGSNRFVAGPGTITAAPRFEHPDRPYLSVLSPAIDAGSSTRLDDLYATTALQRLDATGLRRTKGSAVDIGAFEYGDFSFVHRGPVVDNTAPIDAPPAAALMTSAALPQVTLNVNPGLGAPVSNPHPVGIFQRSLLGGWAIFNEDLADLPAGVSFNVFSPASSPEAFGYNIGANSDASAYIESSMLYLRLFKTLLATHHWNGHGSPGVYNAHAFGVQFDSIGKWYVRNIDGATMASNLAFNIYSQDESPQAYRHVAGPGNTVGSMTLLDHPRLNGNPCAIVTVTPQTLLPAPTPVGVIYSIDRGRHAIVNQNGSFIPNNAGYFVLVDEAQIDRDCSANLFHDGLETRGAP